MPLDSLLPIGTDNKSLPEQGKGRIQFVQEILEGNLTLGYLRITLEEQKLLAAQDTQLKISQEKQRLMLLVMLLAGLLISYGCAATTCGCASTRSARHRPRQATMPHRLASNKVLLAIPVSLNCSR